MSRNYLSKNDELRGGDYLLSNNGQSKAVFQEDGDLVIYTNGKPTWSSNTAGSDACRLVMQADCNLVMYNRREQPKWATNTVNNCKMCHLRLTDDGKLMLYREGDVVWSVPMVGRCGVGTDDVQQCYVQQCYK